MKTTRPVIKYFEPITLFSAPRMRIETTKGETCNLCQWSETKSQLHPSPVVKLITSNSDEMYQTTATCLCMSHLEQLRTAFGVVIELKNLISGMTE